MLVGRKERKGEKREKLKRRVWARGRERLREQGRNEETRDQRPATGSPVPKPPKPNETGA